MIKINHIYLDLDGVLTDFHSEYGNHTKEEWSTEFPKFIDRGGFAKLKKLPDADQLLSFLDSLNLHITILSSAGGFYDHYHQIVAQKHDWLAEHNIKYPALVVPSKGIKAKYANRNSLLIDDQVTNASSFMNAGGLSIIHKNAESTITSLKVFLT